ncbi:uncharacterized protein LOC119578597 [Penaeus monodon]|uniref:uncharacterized protein LOC119578597 n=1 Tax=Penaeus monodon TaxID=6687 RepID=UPI0018A7A119|nr:uncharacterized protein LOC119578597 [Penaeus monodon]
MIKDVHGNVLSGEEDILRRWEYFEKLMNVENTRRERGLEDAEVGNQYVQESSREEVRQAMRMKKGGKAVGPDNTPIEAWRCLGEMAVATQTVQHDSGRAMFKTATITEEKNAIKIWERVLKARLRITVENCDVQLGFMPRRSTTDTIFTLRMVMEKFMEGQRGLQWVFIDLQKAYDKVPKD